MTSDAELACGFGFPAADIFLFKALEPPLFGGDACAVAGVGGSSAGWFFAPGISDAGLSALPVRPFGSPSGLIFSRPFRYGACDLCATLLDFLLGFSSTGGNWETPAVFYFMML